MFRAPKTERLLVLVIRWLLLAFAVWVAAELVGGISYRGTGSILAVALILGLLNMYLRPLLFLISLPATILTLGLFIIVLNAIMLLLADVVAGWLDIDFSVNGLGAAILGALVIAIVNVVTGWFIHPQRIARHLSGGF